MGGHFNKRAMRATFYSILLVLFGFGTAKAQTFTFQCVDSTALTGLNCDVCPNSTILSRSLCGLLISKNGVPYRWIDQPYTMRAKTGEVVEYLELIPNQDKITIARNQTPYSTVQGMMDSTWCHCVSGAGADTTALFYASDSLNYAPVFRGDTLTIVGRNLAQVTFDSLLQKWVINVDSISGGATDLSFSVSGSSPITLFSSTGNDVGIIAGAGIGLSATATDLTITNTGDLSNTNEIQTYAHTGTTSYTNTLSLGGGAFTLQAAGILTIGHTGGTVTFTAAEAQTANNGLSDNEAGGIFRWGNRYMNGSDGLFSNDRKQNVNAFMAFHGDNTDSLLFIVDGTNDRIGIGRLPVNRLDVAGASGTYIRVGTSGAVANSGLILNNSADLADTWAVYRQGDGDFAIGADADNEWPGGTLTDPFIIKPSPPSNSFYMDASGFVALAGTTAARRFDNYGETRLRDLVTDTPTGVVGHDADGDLATVGFSGMSMIAGVLTATDGSTTNEAWTIDGDDADTEVISNQTVKFQGASGVTTDYNPGTNVLLITGPGSIPILTANNALTITGTNLQWGGSLVQNTTVDQDAFWQLHKDGRKEFFRYNTGNPFTDANVTGTVDITGKAAAPSINTAPSEDNILTIRGHNGTATYYGNAMFFGTYATEAYGSWIQTRSESAYTTHYPLNLNAAGGKIGIGRDPQSNTLDAHVTISQALTGSTITGILLHIENTEGEKAAMSFGGGGNDIIDGEAGYFSGANVFRLTNRNTESTASVRIAVGGETADEIVVIPAGTGFGTNVTTNIKSTIQDEGSLGLKTTTSSGDLTLNETHCVVVKNAGSAGVTWTLPDPDLVVGRMYWLMNHTSQTITLSRNVTTATGGVTFNTIGAGEWAQIVAFNGNGWRGHKQVSL